MGTSHKITEYIATCSTRNKDIQNTQFLWCSFCFFCVKHVRTLHWNSEHSYIKSSKITVQKQTFLCEICSAFIYSCATSYIIHSKLKIRQICDSIHMPDCINLEGLHIHPLWQHFHNLNFSYLCYIPKWKDTRYIL